MELRFDFNIVGRLGLALDFGVLWQGDPIVRRTPDSLPAPVRGLSGRFPIAALRLFYVQARIAMFRFTDWLK